MKPVLSLLVLLVGAIAWPVPGAQPPTDYTGAAAQAEPLPDFVPPAPPPTEPNAEPRLERSQVHADGLRRCIGADGGSIFTDRRCSDVDAVDAPVPVPGAQASVSPVRVRSCARNQDDLLAGVRAALENHDANRLAEYYHWSGMGTSQGYRMMERLDAFSGRPVIDVQLVTAAEPVGFGDWDGATFAGPGFADGGPLDPDAERSRPRPARMLRVDQMRSDKDISSLVTYFHLRTNAGCWWMQF